MKLTKDILLKYQEDGWIRSQSHPTLPLMILNYTQKAQYESHWDEITLNCRGLIVDADYKIIVQPFGKFFNYEEIENKGEIPLSGDYVYVQDKMDGSFGILFWYESEWVMATRGSFTSDQAIRGLEIANRLFNLAAWEKSIAYACEIIYPENRIVVDYGSKEKLVFLSAFYNRSYNHDTDTNELHWTTTKTFFNINGIPYKYIVHTEQHFTFGTSLYKALKVMNHHNSEGFILRFHPSNYRMKIKFEDYIRLHRIITNVSSYDVWESLMLNGGMSEETLSEVPDEFYDWVRNKESELRAEFEKIENEYKWIHKIIRRVPETSEAKVYAEYAKRYKHSGILFSMNNGKDYSATIWKLIKPKYEKPFSDNEL
jgi:RNA ligase